ncbi:MAG: septum site-determining protein MinD, partial [Pseudomonadota bacterium]|nr:septum site-determining protein MinD [Pseudomonadota bacterium]
GIPITLDNNSEAGQAYLDVVARYLGEEPPERKKKGFFSTLFKKKS